MGADPVLSINLRLRNTLRLLCLALIFSHTATTRANEPNGRLTGNVGDTLIDALMHCELPAGGQLLFARSTDQSGNRRDTDGDGLFIEIGAQKEPEMISGSIVINDNEVRFGQPGTFDTTGFSIVTQSFENEGQSVEIKLTLACSPEVPLD